jgi:hypothetical protein
MAGVGTLHQESTDPSIFITVCEFVYPTNTSLDIDQHILYEFEQCERLVMTTFSDRIATDYFAEMVKIAN